MEFNTKLKAISSKHNSLVCIGLDIDKTHMPPHLFSESTTPYFDFTSAIIDATKDLICAYKLNMAFYEALGPRGMEVLRKTIEHIPSSIITILDGKRNDIGNTATKYAQALYTTYKADAVTINPYLGSDSITPFLAFPDKCSFILCRTSNPSAGEIQDLKSAYKPIYHHVAQYIKQWNAQGHCGAVVGATYPKELKEIRSILGDDIPILIPGIGKQGGDIQSAVKYGANSKNELALINSSRAIIYAGTDASYITQVRTAAQTLRDTINNYR